MATYTVGPAGSGATYTVDGSSDQTEINQALSAAAASPGSTVYLKGPFTYTPTGTVQIGSNTELTGDSTACLKVPNSAAWAHGVAIISQSVSVPTNIRIHGFEINANRWNQSEVEGDGYYNCISLGGGTSTHATNIEVYDMYIHDSLGDGVRLNHVDNVHIYNNRIEVPGHECVFLLDSVGGDIHNNTFIQKCNSAVRTDNCQNINIHHNTSDKHTVDTNGNSAIQIGNQPASYGLTRLTQNINIYENTLRDSPGSGIMLMDAYGAAGTTPQTVHIWNNTITGCGWKPNYVKYAAGISIWNWGNGAVIEYNTIDTAYNAGLLIFGAITSGCTIQFKNNNILNTKNSGSTDPTRMLNVTGYGILNTLPAKMTVYAEDNYFSNSATGNYYQVTPISESTSLRGDYDTSEGNTPSTRYIPPIRIIQEELTDYYITGKTGYINGVPFTWKQKKTDITRSIGQNKAPGVIGWNLTDFDFMGAELTLDCYARSIAELYEVIAAFYDTSRGRSTLELGGPYLGTKCTGITANHSSDLRLNSDIPEKAHPYSVLFVMDRPYLESASQKVRGRHVYGSMQWSADDTYTGNLLKNPSFESWTSSNEMTWVSETSAADNEWRCVRWSEDLKQYCAVSGGASDSSNTHIMTSANGDTWAIPASLASTPANRNNKWTGLTWGSCIGASAGTPNPYMLVSSDGFVPVSSDGYVLVSGDITPPIANLVGRWVAVSNSASASSSIYSEDGATWTAGGATSTNLWSSVCYVRNDALPVYRYIAVSSGAGETNRVMYSDDGAETWTAVASADDTNGLWISICYSDSIKRLVVVAYQGAAGKQAMYSNDYGATWTLATTPTPNQLWTDVKWAESLGLFVACSETDPASASDTSQQIMTSPDGATWTLQTTPSTSATVTPGTGTEVSTTTYQTPAGWNYTTSNTAWHTGALTDASSGTGGILSIDALTNGHKWKIDRVFVSLRTATAGQTASFKVTARTATISETTLAEWTSTLATFENKTLDVSFESASNEAITLIVYMKSTSTAVKAVATSFGYELTEFNGAGGSSIAYNFNKWKNLMWSEENSILVCVANTGAGNRVMKSTDALNWVLLTSPADNNWLSGCYSPYLNKFVAVAGSGTGNRVMSSSDYGGLQAPSSWVRENTGQARSDSIAHDGIYSIRIDGDGSIADIGITKQYVMFEPGVSYVLSAWGSVSGLTSGKFAVDVYSGNSIITQILYDENCAYTQLQTTVRFDTTPVDAYIRIHGIDTPNAGAVFFCDDVLLVKATDFELGTTGSSITTLGNRDVIPDVEVRSITSTSSSNLTAGETHTYLDANIHSAVSIDYHADLTITLPPLTDQKYYRFDKFTAKLATANVSGVRGDLKITIKAPSINAGVETRIVEWSSISRLPTYTAKSIDTVLVSATNEQVVLKWYLKTTNSAAKVYADDISYVYTEMIPSVTSSAISIYNTADTLTVMQCCNELKPGCSITINANGTGNYQYTENFADSQYEYTVLDSSGVTYDDGEKILMFSSTGYISYRFDCKYPVTGIPYIVLNVVQGSPLIYIATDTAGAPGTWNAIDGNSTTDVSNTQAYRLLNSGTTLVLNGLTKFHLKIASGGTDPLKINSIFMYAELVTIDAEHPKIFKGQPNTFGAIVDSTSSAIVTLKYRDADLLV
jgi:Right handed beta helix region